MIHPVTNTRRLHCTLINILKIFCNSKYISEIGIKVPPLSNCVFIVARIHSSRSAHYIILYYYPLISIKLESSSSPPSPTRNYHLPQTITRTYFLLPLVHHFFVSVPCLTVVSLESWKALAFSHIHLRSKSNPHPNNLITFPSFFAPLLPSLPFYNNCIPLHTTHLKAGSRCAKW